MNKQEWTTGRVTISIGGQPVNMQMTVPAKPVKIRRMLPVFRQMSNSFVKMSVESVKAAGRDISCRAGCGACCRQPVPVSETEAYELAETVEKMPSERRKKIKKRFRDACRQLAEIGWFEQMDATAGMEKNEQRYEVIHEYFKQNIPCPFLEEEACSIHEIRPLACREYLVTSPPENCSKPSAENIEMVNLAAKPSATLCSVTRSENLNETVNFVPLVLSLEWAENFSEDETKRTGEQWMAEFFTHLTKSEIPAESR